MIFTSKTGIDHFFITDDNFARNKDWEPIADRLIHLRENSGYRLSLYIQVDVASFRIPHFVEKMARSGVRRVFIGLESVNPVIKAVFDEYAANFEEPNFDAIKYFVNHPQNQISQLVSDVLSEKNKLSEFWRKRGSFIEEEHEILYQLVPKVLQEYKLRYISHLIAQAELGIRKASEQDDFEAIMEYQKKYQKLKAVEKLLCGLLGKRTITG